MLIPSPASFSVAITFVALQAFTKVTCSEAPVIIDSCSAPILPSAVTS